MDLGAVKYSINAQKYKEEVSLQHVVTVPLFSDSFVSLSFNSFTVTMNFRKILSDLFKEPKLLLNLNFFQNHSYFSYTTVYPLMNKFQYNIAFLSITTSIISRLVAMQRNYFGIRFSRLVAKKRYFRSDLTCLPPSLSSLANRVASSGERGEVMAMTMTVGREKNERREEVVPSGEN